jgi:membrane protein YdbS with pleckstrin-like domain
MKKEKFANLSTKQLQKRKKYAFILLVTLIAAVVLDVSVLIYNFVIGKAFFYALFVVAAICIVVFIPIYLGKKEIEEELKNREDI